MDDLETKFENAKQEIASTRQLLALAQDSLARAREIREAKKQILKSIESEIEQRQHPN